MPQNRSAGPQATRLLRQALLDFQEAPGRFQTARQEPAVLFGSIEEVLRIATSRAGAAVADDPHARAAQFFVRVALLQPHADLYRLMGLPRDCDDTSLKHRYRLMMRLLHPDFSSADSSLPADAAGRVNIAYETLSSPVRRRLYDESLAAPVPRNPSAVRPPQSRRSALAPAKAAAETRDLRKLGAALAAGGIVATLLLGFYLASTPAAVDLVQRAPADVPLAAARLTAPATPAPGELLEVLVAAPRADAQGSARTLQLDPAAVPTAAPLTVVSPLGAGAPAPEPRGPVSSSPPIPARAETVLASAETPPAPAPSAQSAGAAAAPVAAPAPSAPAMGSPIALVRAADPKLVAGPSGRATLTMAEAHPLLSRLLQQMESGGGERMLTLLDPESNRGPEAQALVRHFAVLTDGARAVKVSQAQFKAEPRDGRLVVTGNVSIQLPASPSGPAQRQLALQAEFALRAGAVVMTRLAVGE